VVFWRAKLAGNRERDRRVTRLLRRQHWAVLRFWEHQLQHGDRVIAKLRLTLDRAPIVPTTRSSTNKDAAGPRS
jgi:G:T-mismatch repair DNA endonuclease (very short patch repair protein)